MGSFAVDGDETAEELLAEVEGGREGGLATEGARGIAKNEEAEAEEESIEVEEETREEVPALKLICGEGDARDTPMEVRRFEVSLTSSFGVSEALE